MREAPNQEATREGKTSDGKSSRGLGVALILTLLLLTGQLGRTGAATCPATPSAPPAVPANGAPNAGAANAPAPSNWTEQVQRDLERLEYDLSWQTQPVVEEIEPAWHAPNRAQGFRTYFNPEGIRVVPRSESAPSWRWGLSLVGYGRGKHFFGVRRASLVPSGHGIIYQRGALEESYSNTAEGLEQQFILPAPPDAPAAGGLPEPRRAPPTLLRAHSGTPTGSDRDSFGIVYIDLALWGTLLPRISDDGQAIDFVTPAGAPALHYAHLKVSDARGDILPSWMEGFSEDDLRGIRLVVDAPDAVYPLTIDPLTTSAAWTGESDQASAYFGASVATAGDVNGDGYSDVLVGAPNYDNGQTDEGRAYLYLGSASGLASTPVWTAEGDQASVNFGTSVAPAGDVNDDGYSDILVGAPWYDNGQVDEGRVDLYLGSASGLAATPAWTAESDQASAGFGFSVQTAGSVNGDGYADIVVGAPYYDNGQNDEGRAYLYLGSASGLAATPAWTAESDQIASDFGISVGTAGDINGDGYADVLVGAPWYDNGQSDEGRAYLYLGSASGLAPAPAWTAESDQAAIFNDGTLFGFSVSTAGDINGDGYADVVIGCIHYDSGQRNEGRAFVYLGSASGLGATAAWTAESNSTDAEFGYSVSTAGDVNGDGYADVLVGSELYENTHLDEGRAYLYLGSPSGLAVTPAWTAGSAQISAFFGVSVATAGDVNGDGYADVIVGASFYDNGQADEGRAYLYLGSGQGLATSAAWTQGAEQSGANFGTIVGTAGDVNGDGYSDVLVAARNYDNGQPNEGRAFVYLGSASGVALSPAWTAEGNQMTENFGRDAGTAGDVNGDGYSDVIVGAPYFSNGDNLEGAAFLYLGSASGLSPSPAWVKEGGQLSAWLGWSVATAGDVNGDGYSDVIVGAPAYDNDQIDEGRAYLYLGSSSGLSSTPVWMAESNQTSAELGAPVASAGDVNGDGYSDVIVVAFWYDATVTDGGQVYLYLGSPSGLGTDAAWTVHGDQSNGEFGGSMGTAGDVNGDGYSDVVIGALGYDHGQNEEGRAYLYMGSASGLAATPAWVVESDQASAEMGFSVATAGDVNGDGYSDVVVGVPLYDTGLTNEGLAYVYLGSASGLATTPAWTAGSGQANTGFGASAATAGDVNGDGYSDLIVSAPGYDTSQTDGGKAFLYYGGGDGLRRIPRQARADGAAPISLLGKSDSETSFRLRERGVTPAGRGRIRLQYEIKPVGAPFNGSGLVMSAVHDTGTPGASGSAVNLDELVSGLGAVTFYHWRARIISSDPFFPDSPWMSLAGNSVTETKLRTAGCVDRDGDGYGVGDPPCVGPVPDCNDQDASVWSTPGETVNLRFTSDTVLAWDPPLSPGGPTSALLYDVLRSQVPGSFLSANCLESDDGPNATATDTQVPFVGQVFFYLTRAQNACLLGLGSLGTSSSGAPRAGVGCP